MEPLISHIYIYIDSISPYFGWLKHLSFFNYALEALLVNEMLYLQLVEERFGLNIDVSCPIIISNLNRKKGSLINKIDPFYI